MPKDALTLLLAAPRGFCAGVDRAIQIVERALRGTARRSMCATRSSTTATWSRGWSARARCSSRSWTRCPRQRPVVFSAHGVPKSVPAEAERRKLFYLDATCPLVSKVHREAERHFAAGRHIVLIGHAGHPR